jgi:hypothetical protein
MSESVVEVYKNGTKIGASFASDVEEALEAEFDWESEWYWDDECNPRVYTRLFLCPDTGHILPLWLKDFTPTSGDGDGGEE